MSVSGSDIAKKVFIVLFALVAVLVVVNGVVLLCEPDPSQFYTNLFSKLFH